MKGTIAGIVLAAGESNRMGMVKQLLDIEGEPLLRHLVRRLKATNFQPIKVVIGAYSELLMPLLSDMEVEVIFNPDFHQGQSTSVKIGINSLTNSNLLGAAFVLGDQPLIMLETYNYLIEIFQCEQPAILLPVFQGQQGNPAIFHRKLFTQLLKVEGDGGGRELFNTYSDQIKRVEVTDPGVVFDIDYPEDYLKLMSIWSKKGGLT